MNSNANTQQRSEPTEPQMSANKIQRRPRRQRRVGNNKDRNSSICPGRSRPRKYNKNYTLGTTCGNGSSKSSNRHSSITGNFRRCSNSNIFSSSCSNMPSSIYLILLAAVILGTDLAISDAEFLQQITTTSSAAIIPLEVTTSITVFKPTITATTLPVNATPTAATKAATLPISNTTLTVTTDSSSTLSTTHKTIISVLTQTKLLTHSLTTTFTTDASSTLPPAVTESNSLTFTSPVSSSTAPVAILEPPSSDSLTKGFSIPTFLPAFPAFSANPTDTAAMLPLPPISSSSFSSEQLQQQQDQLYLDAYNKHHAPKKNLTIQETNVTVQVGSHAYMPCHIRRLMNKPVSWVRVRDGHILSVDQTTFIADQRFQSIFKGENEYTWSLQIKYAQNSDEGWYECQVSTEPKMSAKVYLGVVVPKTELIGDQNRFVKAGSKVALHCIVRGTIEPPSYIIWYRGKTQIMDDNKIGWYTQIDRNIFGNSSDQQNTIGSLIIPFVRKKDSGNYTCQPSNSASVSVDLHVLSGEYSASAIMSSASSYKHNSCYIFLLLLFAAQQRT